MTGEVAIRPETAADVAEVDRERHGSAFQVWPTPAYEKGLRGALVYPDVFWRHDALGLRP